jgi:hypothetical protein
MGGLLIKIGGITQEPQPQYNIHLVKAVMELGEGTRILVGKEVDEEFIKNKSQKEKKLYCFSNHKDFPPWNTALSELKLPFRVLSEFLPLPAAFALTFIAQPQSNEIALKFTPVLREVLAFAAPVWIETIPRLSFALLSPLFPLFSTSFVT